MKGEFTVKAVFTFDLFSCCWHDNKCARTVSLWDLFFLIRLFVRAVLWYFYIVGKTEKGGKRFSDGIA